MPQEDWTDYAESMDAFWMDVPDLASMAIEDRELWHQFAAAAERHATAELIYTGSRLGLHEAFPRRVVTRP